MYEARIRMMSTQNSHIRQGDDFVLLDYIKTYWVKIPGSFRIIFNRIVTDLKPDISGLKGPDFGFLVFDNPNRLKDIISDLE